MKIVKVLDNAYLGNGVYELELSRDGIDYKSGNCLSLFGEDKQTYGVVSSYLTSLQPGDEVRVSNPFGWFKPGHQENSIFIATGVGLSPFLSSCRSGLKIPVMLYLGIRGFSKDFLYPIMAEMAGPYFKNYSKIKVCHSRERVNEQMNDTKEVILHYNGRVTDKITEDFKSNALTSDEKYYLCGNDSMIEEVKNILLSNNVPEENIFAETFFNN